MNVLRKAMGREIEELKPLLDDVYAAIVRFQRDRRPQHEATLRDAMAPAVDHLMRFRPLLPAYKDSDFRLLLDTWRTLPAGELIMLFDHCVHIMHVRLERTPSDWERRQPWTADLRHLLDSYRDAPSIGPVQGEFLCSGIAASGGRVTAPAFVRPEPPSLDDIPTGVALVCRFALPDLVPALPRLAALVTDEGGALSHTAIMAREAGVPAVTGCGDATAVIADGTLIQVDGDLGLVMDITPG
jgi:phosphohistidine swiveling domain-containing protein